MFLTITRLIYGVLPLAVLLLAACAPHSTSYTIGGTVTGLNSSTGLVGGIGGLVLQDNGGDNLTVSANGGFTFATKISGCNGSTSASGVSSTNCGVYNVTVLDQPSSQTCTVTNGSGTATGNVSNVLVSCTTVSNSASYAYVANSGSGNISQYTIASDGALTLLDDPLNSNPTSGTVPAGSSTASYPCAISVSPNLLSSTGTETKYVYVANSGDNRIYQYYIDANGGLMPLSPASVPMNTGSSQGVCSIALDSSGPYVYVINSGSNNISEFNLNTSTGQLSPMSSPYVAMTSSPSSIAFDPVNNYVYVATLGSPSTDNGSISIYSIGSTGGLTLLQTISSQGPNPSSIAVDPSGTYSYVANVGVTNTNNNGSISEYSISNGGWTLLTTTNTNVTNPVSITVDSLNQYVYVANAGGVGGISIYSIQTNGELTSIIPATGPSQVLAGSTPYSIALDPSSQFIYVANIGSSSNSVSQYSIGNGVPASITSAATAGLSPISIITTAK